MLRNKLQKIVIAFLILSQLIWPYLVLAQVSVPVTDSNNGNTAGGVAGVLTNTSELAILTGYFKTLYQVACLAPVQYAEKGYAAAHFSASTAAITNPSGSALQIQAMTDLDTVYLTYMICAGLQLGQSFVGTAAPPIILANLPASSTYVGNVKQQYLNQITQDLNNYSKKEQNLSAQLDSANQGFWKTLLISVLLQTSKAVADALVSKLVSNYKITNLKQYTNSVATLMYDNQFIRDNFPDSQGQLMARAILENPAFRAQIQPGIFAAADAALGYNPSAINPASPTFYTQMAAAGSSSANPYFMQSSYVAGVDQSHAASMATAQQQISQGSGYKAPVNCAGALSQQQQIDTIDTAAQAQLANRQALLLNLQQAQAAGQKVSASDINKAQSDYNASLNAWNNLPYTVSGTSSVSSLSASGGNNTEGSMAIVMCEAVSSPAVLINQGINSIFTALGGNLTQYNSSNLPAYINTITGVASQIGTSMVLGGLNAGASSALVNENKTVAATAQLGGQISSSNTASNLGSGIVFYSTQGSGSSATLNWQISTAQLTTASYVTVTGPGLQPGNQPLTGSVSVAPSFAANYVLTVFSAANQNLGSSTVNVIPSSGAGLSYNNTGAPEVAGAFIAATGIATRGPLPDFEPRGPR